MHIGRVLVGDLLAGEKKERLKKTNQQDNKIYTVWKNCIFRKNGNIIKNKQTCDNKFQTQAASQDSEHIISTMLFQEMYSSDTSQPRCYDNKQ